MAGVVIQRGAGALGSGGRAGERSRASHSDCMPPSSVSQSEPSTAMPFMAFMVSSAASSSRIFFRLSESLRR